VVRGDAFDARHWVGAAALGHATLCASTSPTTAGVRTPSRRRGRVPVVAILSARSASVSVSSLALVEVLTRLVEGRDHAHDSVGNKLSQVAWMSTRRRTGLYPTDPPSSSRSPSWNPTRPLSRVNPSPEPSGHRGSEAGMHTAVRPPGRYRDRPLDLTPCCERIRRVGGAASQGRLVRNQVLDRALTDLVGPCPRSASPFHGGQDRDGIPIAS